MSGSPAHALPDAVLTEEHRRQLEVESAIPPDLIAEEGIRSLAGAYELPTPSETVRHPDPRKGRRFGRRPDVLGSGIYFPIGDPSGEVVTYQFKPDKPRIRKKQDGGEETVKYETPAGTRLVIYAPRQVRRWLKTRARRLWITEGVKKVLAGVGAGLCIVGLMGVDGWVVKTDPELPSEPLPDWDAIELFGRIVLIAFDSDVMTKPEVKAALRRLSEFLESRGAMVVPVVIPPGPNGEKQGLDDHIAVRLAAGVSREDAVAELENAALVEAIKPGTSRQTAGSNGEASCRGCALLRERLRVHRAADELLRRGPVSPGEASVLWQLATVAASARSRGEPRQALYRPALATAAGVNEKTVTRAFNTLRRWQSDPETAARLPFRLATRSEGGKDHVDLIVARCDDADGDDGPSLARDLRTLARLPRPAERAPWGGYRCPAHPDARVIRVTAWRCSEDGCGRVVGQKIATLGKHHNEPVPVPETPYVGQDVPHKSGGDDPGGPLIPASFVSRDDAELFDDPHYRALPEDDPADDDAVDDAPGPRAVPAPSTPTTNGRAGHLRLMRGWTPPPPAPASHVAAGFRRRPPPDSATPGGTS